MKISKAIIWAAGFGTRFLPYTKSVQKEMLPVLARPMIDYVIDDCVKAGVTEIIIVVNEQNGYQIRSFYSENSAMHEYLIRMRKPEKYDLLKDIHTKAKFTFVTQPDNGEYGTAVPLKLAKEHVIKEDAFLVFGGDDFIFNQDGQSEAGRMIDLFLRSGADALVTCMEVSQDKVNRYGIVEYRAEGDFKYLTNIIEKPSLEDAPSNLANISKYIFTPKIFNYLENQQVNPQSGELYVTDTYKAMAKDCKEVVYIAEGRYLDCGDPLGWLKTNLTVAMDNPEMKSELVKFMKSSS